MNSTRQNQTMYLVPILAFALIVKTSFAYLFAFLNLVAWVWDGSFKHRIKQLLANPFALSFVLIFTIHLVGLLWTESLQEGLRVVSKQKVYIFAALMVVLLDRNTAKLALKALIAAIFLSEVLALYNYITGPEGGRTSPFMHHMHYSLVLCFTAAYLVSLIQTENRYSKNNLILSAGAVLTLLALFLNQGRIGFLALPVVTFVLVIYKFKLPLLRAMVSVLIAMTLLFSAAYNFSAVFKNRVDVAYYEFTEVVGTGKRRSIACRFEMWKHALNIGSDHLLLGVGTGDSVVAMKSLMGEAEYEKMHKECHLGHKYQINIHNNYIQVFLQFGLIGLVLFLTALWMQLRIALKSNNLPMTLLIVVSAVGMLTTGILSIHTKYMFFYTIGLGILYRLHGSAVTSANQSFSDQIKHDPGKLAPHRD